MKILILGSSGMLGSAFLNRLSKNSMYRVYGTLRKKAQIKFFPPELKNNFFIQEDMELFNFCSRIIKETKPCLVINCIGMIKQLNPNENLRNTFLINSLFPHVLANYCKDTKSHLIHFSTDCVFDGKSGNYSEENQHSAEDIYGISKSIGEVSYKNSLTIRTSIIGHELRNKKSLLEWFLGESQEVQGYKNAIFSGLPTNELAAIIDEKIIQRKLIHGIYNVSSQPISKFDLLQLIKRIYDKDIIINPEYSFKINRSLNSSKFRKLTGFEPRSWEEMIISMRKDNEEI